MLDLKQCVLTRGCHSAIIKKWLAHCDVPEIVRSVPHIAFAIDDLDEAIKGREVLIAPTEPSAGVRVAFILDDGAPVELLEFYTVKAVRPKTRHAAEQRAAPDDGAPAKEMRRRR